MAHGAVILEAAATQGDVFVWFSTARCSLSGESSQAVRMWQFGTTFQQVSKADKSR